MFVKFFDGAVEHLARGLAFATRRHEIISQNIANVETPGYKARDLVFDDLLRPVRQVAADSPGVPLPTSPAERLARVVYSADSTPNPDGNDVNLDRQMARLAENTLFHHALVQMLSGQFTALKQSISGRV